MTKKHVFFNAGLALRGKRRLSLLLSLLLLFPWHAPGAQAAQFTRHGARDDTKEMLITYWVCAPADQAGLPLVVYLHGSGERGEGALLSSLPLFVKQGTVLCNEAVLLVPQMPSAFGQWAALDDALMKMIERTLAEYQADESRVLLVGFSMGGIGVFDLANLHRGMFSRVMSVSGRVNDEVEPDAFATVETRIFVGTKDTNMPPQSALRFAQTLEDAGYDAEAIQMDATHSRMPYRVFQNDLALRWIGMELAPTPEPTPSPTPKPTATPKPTPKPTATPRPTATPKPSAAPKPTETPKPVPSPSPTLDPAATPTPDLSGYRTLKPGMTGRDVQRFKIAMYWLGYFNTKDVSDVFNAVTVERVKQLQKNNGLEQTGVADPALQALVFSGNAVKTKNAPRPSSTPKPK